MTDPFIIEMMSGVSAFTGEPFVTLRWGRESGQLTPDEVRQHAMFLLATAEAAESDAAVVRALRTDMKVDTDIAIRFIGSLREHRGKAGGPV